MNVRELLKKYKIPSNDLSDELLSIEFDYVYTKVEKDKIVMDTLGYRKREFEVYRFTGDDCECLFCPQNEYETLSFYYKTDTFAHGYGYDKEGNCVFVS